MDTKVIISSPFAQQTSVLYKQYSASINGQNCAIERIFETRLSLYLVQFIERNILVRPHITGKSEDTLGDNVAQNLIGAACDS